MESELALIKACVCCYLVKCNRYPIICRNRCLGMLFCSFHNQITGKFQAQNVPPCNSHRNIKMLGPLRTCTVFTFTTIQMQNACYTKNHSLPQRNPPGPAMVNKEVKNIKEPPSFAKVIPGIGLEHSMGSTDQMPFYTELSMSVWWDITHVLLKMYIYIF